MEDKSHVALDLALQKSLSCFDSLPGGGNFDKDSLSAHTRVLVEGDNSLRPFDSSSLVEGEASIYFS